MANYAVEPSLLAPFLPKGTELDLWNNICYVSLVGFLFLNTRLRGVKIPFHSNFEEVNLRFYVTRRDRTGIKRGVVFLKEFVPKHALTFVANAFYGEHYQTVPMNHVFALESSPFNMKVGYNWKLKEWNSFVVTAETIPTDIVPGGEEEFITEHYWGYTKVGSTRTSEYAVEHPRWQVYPVTDYTIDVNFGLLYGSPFDALNKCRPVSVFLAEGSEIIVRGAKVLQEDLDAIAKPKVSEPNPEYKVG